jgi:hypothetical protein
MKANPGGQIDSVDISGYQKGTKWLERLFGKFTKSFAGWQIGNIVKIPETSIDRWKEILENAIEYLMSHPLSVDDWEDGKKAKQMIFFWDELPMMLDNFLKRENGALVAMEVLDTLCALRQTYPQLRMVYTGSIRLHHVVNKLKDAGFDTPLPKGERILGSTTSLKLATLQLLAQRCDLPKRLRVCPTLVGLLQVFFDWCKISTKSCLSSSSKYFTYCEVEARILQ